MTTFTRDLLIDALTELGTLAAAEGKVVDVAIYGGSALMLASNFRVATRDVDAVADDEGQRVIDRLAAVVAARRGWPESWLNDQVYPFLSDQVDGLGQHHELFRSYPCEQAPGVRIFVPTPEYILAMKLMAMRIDASVGAKDRDDIVNLMAIVGLQTPQETLEFVAAFYPEARVSEQVGLGLQDLFGSRDVPREDWPDDAAPTYLGRGRAAHQRG